MIRSASFAPLAAPDTRLLILGSLPGAASLAAGRYYAHPQNRFWHLMGAAIDADLCALPYDGRLAALRQAHIGLWDVIRDAHRPGSLDAAIRDPAANDLAALAAALPELNAIAFNGATAARLGRRALGAAAPWPLLRLPSSSPAHAAMNLDTKRAAWLTLRAYL